MSRKTSVPERMCMGCGARAPQPELVRLSSTADGHLAVVRTRAHRGRTGYLHRRPECWDRFAARRGPLRSLGRSVDKTIRAAVVHELKHGGDFAIMGELACRADAYTN